MLLRFLVQLKQWARLLRGLTVGAFRRNAGRGSGRSLRSFWKAARRGRGRRWRRAWAGHCEYGVAVRGRSWCQRRPGSRPKSRPERKPEMVAGRAILATEVGIRDRRRGRWQVLALSNAMFSVSIRDESNEFLAIFSRSTINERRSAERKSVPHVNLAGRSTEPGYGVFFRKDRLRHQTRVFV